MYSHFAFRSKKGWTGWMEGWGWGVGEIQQAAFFTTSSLGWACQTQNCPRIRLPAQQMAATFVFQKYSNKVNHSLASLLSSITSNLWFIPSCRFSCSYYMTHFWYPWQYLHHMSYLECHLYDIWHCILDEDEESDLLPDPGHQYLADWPAFLPLFLPLLPDPSYILLWPARVGQPHFSARQGEAGQ